MPTVTVSRATAANAEAEVEVEVEGEVITKNSQNHLHPFKNGVFVYSSVMFKSCWAFLFSFIRYSLCTCIYSIVKLMYRL